MQFSNVYEAVISNNPEFIKEHKLQFPLKIYTILQFKKKRLAKPLSFNFLSLII